MWQTFSIPLIESVEYSSDNNNRSIIIKWKNLNWWKVTLDNGTFTVRVYYNTTDALDGSQILLATYTSTNVINQISFTRSFGIISATETQLLIPQSTSSAGDFIASSNSVVTTLNIDWTKDLYIIWAIQNSSASDTTVIARNKLWKK